MAIYYFRRSHSYLTAVLLCQHNHLHAALVLSVIHTDEFQFSTLPNWGTSLCTLTDTKTDTYAIVEAEPHSVVRSKSCMARSGQQWIMTRKWTSQRLRVSYGTEQFIRKPWLFDTGMLVQQQVKWLNSPQCQEYTRDFPPPPSSSHLKRFKQTGCHTFCFLSQILRPATTSVLLFIPCLCPCLKAWTFYRTDDKYSYKWHMNNVKLIQCTRSKSLPGIKLLLTEWARHILDWWGSIVQWVTTFSLSPYEGHIVVKKSCCFAALYTQKLTMIERLQTQTVCVKLNCTHTFNEHFVHVCPEFLLSSVTVYNFMRHEIWTNEWP